MKNKERYGKRTKIKDMPVGTYFKNGSYINFVNKESREACLSEGECINYSMSEWLLGRNEIYVVISPEDALSCLKI